MSDWWRAVEDALERRGADAPDPWADAHFDVQHQELSDEQRQFLEQVADTPHARFDDD